LGELKYASDLAAQPLSPLIHIAGNDARARFPWYGGRKKTAAPFPVGRLGREIWGLLPPLAVPKFAAGGGEMPQPGMPQGPKRWPRRRFIMSSSASRCLSDKVA